MCVLADCEFNWPSVSLSCFCGWRIADLCCDPLTKHFLWRQALPLGFVSPAAGVQRLCWKWSGFSVPVVSICLRWLRESWNLEMLLIVRGAGGFPLHRYTMNCLFRCRLG